MTSSADIRRRIDKNAALGLAVRIARPPVRIINLAYARMQEGDREFGDSYKSEDLAYAQDEERADDLCYWGLRMLRNPGCLSPRQRLGLRIWGLSMRLMGGDA
jgi:hypothetical protein